MTNTPNSAVAPTLVPQASSPQGPNGNRHWTAAVNSKRGSLAAYAAFAVLTCLFRLGSVGLVSMEGLVVDGASEMVATGEWSVPVVYGELYTYKPPLAYWLAALPLLLFDQPSEFLLRLPGALSGVILGFAVLLLVGRTLSPRVGLFAAMATTGVPLFMEKIRLAEFDALLTAGAGIAIVAASCALARAEDRLGLWVVAYLSLTFGFLAKGIPALMVYGPGLLVAAAFTSGVSRLFRLKHLVGTLFFLVPTTLYLLWAVDSAGTAIFDHPLLEGRCRGLEWSLETLGQTLLKPAMILVAFLPWSLVLVLLRRSRQGLGIRSHRLLLAGSGFLVGGAITFVAVPSHVMRYYLPLCAAHALVVAVVLEAALSRAVPKALTAGLKALLMLVAVSSIVAASYNGFSGWMLTVVAVAVITTVAMLRQHSRGTSLATLLVALSLIVGIAQAGIISPRRALTRDLSGIANALRPRVPPGETLYVLGPSDYASKIASLHFYLDRRVRTFDLDRLPPRGAFLLRGHDALITPLPEGYVELASEQANNQVYRLIKSPDRSSPPTREEMILLFPESVETHSPGCQKESTRRQAN